MSEGPLFILAGNGPYLNRGCEAIVRGTVNILRQQYDNPRFVCISHFNSREEFTYQQKNEIDNGVRHLSSSSLNKHNAISTFYKPKTWRYIHRSFISKKKMGYSVYSDVLPYLSEAKAVLSIGGDNYSLDYGKPNLFTALDDLVLSENKPLIIWGASVGPFDKIPDYEAFMSRHLREVTGIFARESNTIDYLKRMGVSENVYPVADPAFLMNAVKPEGIEDDLPLDEDTIGINLSPLMAKYVTGGDIEKWIILTASIIDDLAQKTGMPVCLIPHVTVPTSNDYAFMQRVISLVTKENRDVVLVPPKYNAAETKWIISQMTVFAGARTHSTIAALSSGVPTLSFAYSIKAQGINWDLFGHNRYCLEPNDFDAGHVSNQIMSMLDEGTAIRNGLMERMVTIRKAASRAAVMLKRLAEER